MKIFFISVFMLTLFVHTNTFARSFSYNNEQATDGDMMAEWLARPAGVVGTAAGFITFVAGLPFSVLSEENPEKAYSTEESFNTLVADPFLYTFNRPLGHYSAQGE